MKKHNFQSMVITSMIAIFLLTSCGAVQTSSGWPGLTVDNGIAYLANGNQVFAVKVGKEKATWRYPEKIDGTYTFYAPPVLLNGKVYVGSYQKTFYSLDPTQTYQVEDGKKTVIRESWKNEDARGHYIAGVLAIGNTVLAPSSDKTLYSFSLQGSKQKSFTTGQALWSTPVTDGSNIFLASMDHHLYGLKSGDLSPIWPKIDLGAAVAGGIALSQDGQLFVTTVAGDVITVNSKSGQISGRYKTSAGIWSKPLVNEGVLYIGDLNGNFYALQADNLSEKWKKETNGAILASAEFTPKGIVIVNEKGDVNLFGKNGEKIWTRTTSGNNYTAPVYSNACEFTQGSATPCIVVAVKHAEKSLFAYDLEGNEKWSFNTPN